MRKHPRYLFTVIIFTVLNGYAYAQGPNPLPSNIASAPSVNGKGAGLANLYTGQPQIQIPLLSYGVHDLSHNVSLLYNATGTTVSQIASPVGLGWSLSATYFVKRIAVGPPDEFKYLQGGTWKSSGYLVTGNIPSTPTRADLDNFYYNKADGEADIYLFSIPGQSGRIIINKSGLVVKTIPESGLSITPTMQPGGGRIISFIIRTESGLVYEFTEEEVIKYKTKIDNTDYEFDYTSTWFVKAFYHHLDPAAKITFDYGSYYSNDILGKQDFTARANNANVHFALGSICYASQGSCCVQTWSYATEDIKVNGYLKRLNRVNFPDGAYYRFLHTYSRCDLTHEGALLSMEQYNQLGTLMKRYEFGYAYFSESGEVGFEDCSTLDLTKKLKLKSITEYISYSNALPPYTFEYESSINLPARTSTDIDEWGFLPKSSSLPDGGSKAYVLTRINYPTGSYVTYEYELNQVGWTKSSSQLQTLSGLRVKKITVSEGTNVAPSSNTVTEAHYTYLNNSSASSGEVDYLPFKKFYTYLNYHSVASCVGGNQYSNVEMENRINQSPVAPFPTGNACGYSMVTEEIKSGTDVLGKQVYHFKNFSDYVNDPSISGAAGTMDFPYSNRQYNIPWGLGLLKMIEVKDKDGNVVKRTENDYTVYSTRQTAQNLASLKIGLWYGPVNRSGSAVNGEVYKYDIYGPLTGYTQLDKARDVQVFYDGSTAQEVTSEVTYEYVPNKKLIRSKYAFNSAGNKVKTIYYYPFDYNFTNEQSANPGIGMLNMQQIITPVVCTETWITRNGINYLVASEVQDFQLLSNWHVRPSKKYALKTSAPIAENLVPAFTGNTLLRDANLFEEISSEDYYNSKGNPIQTTSGKKITTSFIYGYNDYRLVASAANAKKDEIAYTGFEDINTNSPSGYVAGGFTITGSCTTAEAITGAKSFNGTMTASLPAGKYIIALWAKNNTLVSVSAPVTNEARQAIRTIEGWTLYKWVVSTTSGNTTVTITSNGSVLDEVKAYPFMSSMSSITYNSELLKVAECDGKNNITYYRYDQYQRLKAIADIEGNIIKTFEYHNRQ